MTKTLVRRVDRVEADMHRRASDLSLLTDEALEARIDELLGRLGTTREQAIAEHGSLKAHRDYLLAQQREEERKHG